MMNSCARSLTHRKLRARHFHNTFFGNATVCAVSWCARVQRQSGPRFGDAFMYPTTPDACGCAGLRCDVNVRKRAAAMMRASGWGASAFHARDR